MILDSVSFDDVRIPSCSSWPARHVVVKTLSGTPARVAVPQVSPPPHDKLVYKSRLGSTAYVCTTAIQDEPSVSRKLNPKQMT